MSDADLLRQLYDQHAQALLRYALHLSGGDRARAQDVVQETLLRAWRNPRALDPARGSPRPWLFAVARHLVIDEWRLARSRPEVLTDQLPEPPIGDGTEEFADRDLVAAALRRLTPAHRDVLYECYFRGSSVAQAAAALGIAPGTVKSRTHYALRALRRALVESR